MHLMYFILSEDLLRCSSGRMRLHLLEMVISVTGVRMTAIAAAAAASPCGSDACQLGRSVLDSCDWLRCWVEHMQGGRIKHSSVQRRRYIILCAAK